MRADRRIRTAELCVSAADFNVQIVQFCVNAGRQADDSRRDERWLARGLTRVTEPGGVHVSSQDEGALPMRECLVIDPGQLRRGGSG